MAVFGLSSELMSEPFVEFWKICKPKSGQRNLHPEDLDWMRSHWQSALNDSIYSTWEEYAASSRFRTNDKRLHLSLFPMPYLGSLREAKVILFLMNPSFGERDYSFEDRAGIRGRLERNLYQEFEDDFPFLFLDPNLSESGGFKWWQKPLRPLLEVLTVGRRTPIQAMELMSQKIAAVELFPYHSVDTSDVKGVGKRKVLPSVLQARSFLERSSRNHQQLSVLLRAHERWAPAGCPKNLEHHYNGPRQQTISLNPKFETGERILAWLER
jgi:hypothetical protein